MEENCSDHSWMMFSYKHTLVAGGKFFVMMLVALFISSFSGSKFFRFGSKL